MPTLLDGTEVQSDSEEWRHECEARAIAALPSTLARRTWLEDIERKRGVVAAALLRQTVAKIWELRQNHGALNHPSPKEPSR